MFQHNLKPSLETILDRFFLLYELTCKATLKTFIDIFFLLYELTYFYLRTFTYVLTYLLVSFLAWLLIEPFVYLLTYLPVLFVICCCLLLFLLTSFYGDSSYLSSEFTSLLHVVAVVTYFIWRTGLILHTLDSGGHGRSSLLLVWSLCMPDTPDDLNIGRVYSNACHLGQILLFLGCPLDWKLPRDSHMLIFGR